MMQTAHRVTSGGLHTKTSYTEKGAIRRFALCWSRAFPSSRSLAIGNQYLELRSSQIRR